MGRENGSIGALTPINYAGNRRAKWNVVILGDGFRSSELGQFATAAERIAGTLLSTPPFDRLGSGINIYRIDVASEESGADDPVSCGGTGAQPRTFFDARFCAQAGLRRTLAVDDGLAWDVARTRVPETHVPLVVVNSPIWGGLGGSAPTCSMAPGAEMIAIHEIGHSFFGLADEYEYYVGCGAESDRDWRPWHHFLEPGEPNVTREENREHLKWRSLVAAGTPVPTTRNADCTMCDPQGNPRPEGTIGLYEGANYYHCGYFRPAFDCMMRNAGAAFCGVCQQQIARRLQPFMQTVTVPQAAVTSQNSGKALDVSGVSRENGASLVQWDWWGGGNQRFRFEEVERDYFRIVAEHSRKVLDVYGVSRDNGARIVQWDWWGGHNQQWRVEAIGNGFFKIVSRHSGKVLDVSGVSRDNGARIIQWDWWGGANQQWRVVGVL